MRAIRRAVPDPEERSRAIAAELRAVPAVRAASTVMLFTPLLGEPDVTAVVPAERAVFPEQDPDPTTLDVVVVPGLAFTRRGDRLGQGGGWYDRFLPRLRPDAVTIGVGFREQLVDELPVEPHDIALDRIITA